MSGGARATPPAIVKGQVVWAVSDVSMVPAGSVLINPDNGTPYLNSDGSVYMFDPSNPPRLEVSQVVPQQQPVASYPPGTPQPPGLDSGGDQPERTGLGPFPGKNYIGFRPLQWETILINSEMLVACAIKSSC